MSDSISTIRKTPLYMSAKRLYINTNRDRIIVFKNEIEKHKKTYINDEKKIANFEELKNSIEQYEENFEKIFSDNPDDNIILKPNIFQEYVQNSSKLIEQMGDEIQLVKDGYYDDEYSGVGGKKSKKLPKKEILGKMRCIYKIPGDRKEYVKHKGKLITVKDYKELMKAKKPTKPTKKK
jgi:hypothetical protein